MKKGKWFYLVLAVAFFTEANTIAQTIAPGINYQAVARRNDGTELKNEKIDIRFSVLSGGPSGQLVYQETHLNKITTDYGVFSLIIGEGDASEDTKTVKFSTFSQIEWDGSPHFLRVEVRFPGSAGFVEMGTMQFMAVPYALYAYKSLEPGPVGPKGDKGDPASDNQTLSFDGKKLSLTVGDGGTPSQVDISSLNPPHALSIIGDTVSILGGNKIGLPNYMQDLTLDVNNILKVTKNPSATSINLSKFQQQLIFNSTTKKLSITDSPGEVDLSPFNQSLSFNKNSGELSISNGNTISLNNSIGFKARKSVNSTGLTQFTTYPFINSDVEFNDGTNYDGVSGIFTASISGIYTFLVTYSADGTTGSARELRILKNGTLYEILASDITVGAQISKWVVIKLNQGETISLTINTGTATVSGTGSFVGYRNN